jgi:predicted TIM-barrel fold metal-dependent hydrolase
VSELRGRIDADVHPMVPDIANLGPFLSEHWREYLSENGFRKPYSSGSNYPAGSPLMPPPAEQSLDAVRANVFGAAGHAILNCAYGAEAVRHPYLAAALATAVNEWIKSEWLEREPRFSATIVVTPQDTAAAVNEIRRVGKDPRFVGVFLAVRTWEPYGNRRYWPIWQAAVEHDLPLVIHHGGFTGIPPTPSGTPQTFFDEHCGATQLFGDQVMSLLVEGVFDEYPALRVCLAESGVSWLPPWMWKLDTDWKATRREIPWVRRLPSEYIREHFTLTAEPLDLPERSPSLQHLLNQLGSDQMLMYSSDYPHRHGSDTAQLETALDGEQREAYLSGNASRAFRLGDRIASAV